MWSVVVGQNADVAELAQERAAARHFQDGAVIAPDGLIQHRPVEGLGLVDGETPFRLDNAIQRVAAAQRLQDPFDLFLAVADEDVVEAVQLFKRACLFERPGDGAADQTLGVRIAALQLGAHAFHVGIVLVDAAEEEGIGFGDAGFRLEAAVGQRKRKATVAGDVRAQRVGPDRHELGAVVLGVGIDRVRRMDEGDPKRLRGLGVHGSPMTHGCDAPLLAHMGLLATH